MTPLNILEEISQILSKEQETELEVEGVSFEEFLKEENAPREKLPKIFDVLAEGVYVAPLQASSTLEISQGPSGIAAAALSSEIYNLFEKIGLITHEMCSSGDSQTTILLDEMFPSKLFQGTEILITEYSTAPKSYNVQINTCSQAVTLLQGQSSALMHSIEQKGYAFKIFRCDVALKQESAKKYKVEEISDKKDL